MDPTLFEQLIKPFIKRYLFDQPILKPTTALCTHCLRVVKNPCTVTRVHQYRDEVYLKHHCLTCRQVVFDGSRVTKRIPPSKLNQLTGDVGEE